MLAKLESKLVSWFRPDPNQPRKTFIESELMRLGESLKLRQIDPLQAKADGLLLDGERRLRAAKLVGIEKLDVIITDLTLTSIQINLIRLTSFFHREGLSAYEKWLACAELMCANPSWQLKTMAEHLHLDPATVTRLMSPSKLTPEWQQALKDGKVTIGNCYTASQLPDADQPGFLALTLSDMPREAVARAAKKLRSNEPTTEPSERTAKIKIPLAVKVDGIAVAGTVTVAGSPGEEVGLVDAERILTQALRSVKDAQKLGLGLKAAQASWRDIAAKGKM